MSISIRDARDSDLEAIRTIFNDAVLNTTANVHTDAAVAPASASSAREQIKKT